MNWYSKNKKDKKKKTNKKPVDKDFIDISGQDMDMTQRPNNTTDSNSEIRLN